MLPIPEQGASGFLKPMSLPLIITVLLFLGIFIFAVFYVRSTSTQTGEALKTDQPTVAVKNESSLGGTLYEKASNPLGDKLPEQSPVANPINDVYKNPFE
ncbi:MAG: hypothetical protein AAB869_00720 [Patescibacteria group bacterium]